MLSFGPPPLLPANPAPAFILIFFFLDTKFIFDIY